MTKVSQEAREAARIAYNKVRNGNGDQWAAMEAAIAAALPIIEAETLERAAKKLDELAEKHRKAACECESDGHRNAGAWRSYQTSAHLAASITRNLKDKSNV